MTHVCCDNQHPATVGNKQLHVIPMYTNDKTLMSHGWFECAWRSQVAEDLLSWNNSTSYGATQSTPLLTIWLSLRAKQQARLIIHAGPIAQQS
jgi:hypothetical protein